MCATSIPEVHGAVRCTLGWGRYPREEELVTYVKEARVEGLVNGMSRKKVESGVATGSQHDFQVA